MTFFVNKNNQPFFPIVPDLMSWEDWNGNFIIYYGQMNVPVTSEENWKDASYDLASAWADCLMTASYVARQFNADQKAGLKSQLTVSLLQKLVDNGRFPADAVGAASDLAMLADAISYAPNDDDRVREALKEVPDLGIGDGEMGTEIQYHGHTWIFQTYPWSSWIVNLGKPASSANAMQLVAQANLRMTDLRLWVDGEGQLLLESPRVPSTPDDLLVRFQDFVQKAEPLLPSLQEFVAGKRTVDALLGGW